MDSLQSVQVASCWAGLDYGKLAENWDILTTKCNNVTRFEAKEKQEVRLSDIYENKLA